MLVLLFLSCDHRGQSQFFAQVTKYGDLTWLLALQSKDPNLEVVIAIIYAWARKLRSPLVVESVMS